MRGKLGEAVENQCAHRITPADAGKTRHGIACEGTVGDHPRGCGENVVAVAASASSLGSPPRMRGKQDGTGIFILRGRITPADAGKTRVW